MRKLAAALLALATVSAGSASIASPGHEEHTNCSETAPEVVELRQKVADSIAANFPDMAAITAAGFIPYFDAVIPYGNPKEWPGGVGTGIPYADETYPDPETAVKHFINPSWMDDEDEVDTDKPESILTDEWGRPLGFMFIAKMDTDGTPLYTNTDGSVCSPWHQHVDEAAVYAFWGYRYFYHGNPEKPEQTPPMMHVWVDNSHGTFAHYYPEADERQGPPVVGSL